MSVAPTSPDDRSETTLVAVTGLSPAVLTETLWALAHEVEPVIPERIVVLTTQTGRERLLPWFAPDGAWARFRADLAAATGLDLRDKLRFGPSAQAIRVIPDPQYARDLADIVTPEDNRATAEFFLEVLRSFTEGSDTRLVASIAGGRKTMGVLLHSVMTLVGRVQDRILHVLVSDPWDRIPGFLYPGCQGEFKHPETGVPLQSAEARPILAEVPFIPLRYLFERDLSRTPHNYIALMNRLRSLAAGFAPELRLSFDPRLCYVEVNGRPVNLSPGEYGLWLAYATLRREREGALETSADIAPWLTAVLDKWHREDDFAHWTWRLREMDALDPSEIGRRWLSTLRAKLRSIGCSQLDVERLVPRQGRFSIELPPENIEITDNSL